MKGLQMTREQAEAHQRKHGFATTATITVPKVATFAKSCDEMNKTEREYSFILEARKRRGEISEYRFQGMTLRWRDPVSGELMRYTADFVVWVPNAYVRDARARGGPEIEVGNDSNGACLELHEIKGGWIKGKLERAVERFRHARTVHPMIRFEMHQKKGGQWRRVH